MSFKKEISILSHLAKQLQAWQFSQNSLYFCLKIAQSLGG
jgi:hypothetical protein